MEAKEKGTILVIGSGVIGLTTSIKLADSGFSVIVAAIETPSSILVHDSKSKHFARSEEQKGTYTSSGSGGLWTPFLLEGDQIEKWATVTFNEYQEILTSSNIDASDIGVFEWNGFFLCSRKEPKIPWYGSLTDMRIIDKKDDYRIPDGYKAALNYTTPIIQMELYLPYLENRAQKLGVDFKYINNPEWSIEDARKLGSSLRVDFFVNCTGVKSASFLNQNEDLGLFPGRGITVLIRTPESKDYFISEDPDDGILSENGKLAYALPRGKNLFTLGGTFFKDDWNESSSREEESGVVERACRLLQVDPDSVAVESSWTGLRPCTSEGSARVRLQESTNDVVDNYGHGGSGVTICWGCAEEVVNIINSLK